MGFRCVHSSSSSRSSLLLAAEPARSAPVLERGTAVTDPVALRELDRGRFGLARMLSASPSSDDPLTDSALFALPAMAPVRKSLDEEFERYVQRHKAELPNETIGVGTQFDFQLFDRDQLYSQADRFVLAGIVNRMDRAFVAPSSCGEIRLIYRLTRDRCAPGRRSRRLGAAADDAQSRLEGESRQRH